MNFFYSKYYKLRTTTLTPHNFVLAFYMLEIIKKKFVVLFSFVHAKSNIEVMRMVVPTSRKQCFLFIIYSTCGPRTFLESEFLNKYE